MTSRDFCYWLQGYFELSGNIDLPKSKVKEIKNHLNLVFKHEIDPSMGDETHQQELSHIHSPHHNAHDTLIRVKSYLCI